MNTRITLIRKSLNISQKEFGATIGLKPSSMNDIEHGKCAVTERVIIAICARFNVNEQWLRTGEGEMFVDNLDFKKFFEIYSKLNKPLQDFLFQCAKNLLDAQNKL